MTTALFAIGLVLELAGFLLAWIDHVPALLRIVFPSFVNATSAVKRLRDGESVRRGNIGFDSLERIFMAELAALNPGKTLANVSIVRFECTGREVTISPGERGIPMKVPVAVHLSDGQETKRNLIEIESKVDALRSSRLFSWGVGLFVLGMTLQIVGFLFAQQDQSPAA